jgi:hypothetical protein
LDCQAYKKLTHPAAHFHIGMHAENRWPTARKLTPRFFALFIAKCYYAGPWSEFGKITEDDEAFDNRFDRTFVGEKNSCLLLGPDLFHDHERNQLHLA